MRFSVSVSLFVAAAALLFSGASLAFGGCVDSPENPTLVLGAIGGAAAGLPWLKAKVSAWATSRRHGI